MKGLMVIAGLMMVVLVAGCSTTGYVVKERGLNAKGPENAKVTIIEYSDFECPFCERAVPTMEQILEKYPNDVRLIFKHVPLSFHAQAEKAGEGAACAGEQGKFWEMHDLLWTNTAKLQVPDLN